MLPLLDGQATGFPTQFRPCLQTSQNLRSKRSVPECGTFLEAKIGLRLAGFCPRLAAGHPALACAGPAVAQVKPALDDFGPSLADADPAMDRRKPALDQSDPAVA